MHYHVAIHVPELPLKEVDDGLNSWLLADIVQESAVTEKQTMYGDARAAFFGQSQVKLFAGIVSIWVSVNE